MGGCLGEYIIIIYEIFLGNTFCKMYYILFYCFSWFTLTHILDSSKLWRCRISESEKHEDPSNQDPEEGFEK